MKIDYNYVNEAMKLLILVIFILILGICQEIIRNSFDVISPCDELLVNMVRYDWNRLLPFCQKYCQMQENFPPSLDFLLWFTG